MDNRLKELLDEVADKEATTKIEPARVQASIRAGTEAMVRNATADLPKVKDLYMNEVMNHVIIIAVNGPGQDEFANIAKYKYDTRTVDYKLVQKTLTDRIKARNASNKYTNQEHFLLLDELTKIKTEYQMVQLPPPRNNGYMEGAYNKGLEEGLETLIKINYGSSLNSAITRREIGKLALEDKFSAKYYAVVLKNFTGNDAVDIRFLPQPVTIVDTGTEKITEKEVKSVLDKVNTMVRGTQSRPKKKSLAEGTKETTNG